MFGLRNYRDDESNGKLLFFTGSPRPNMAFEKRRGNLSCWFFAQGTNFYH